MENRRHYNTRRREQLLEFFRVHEHDSFTARELIENRELSMGEATVFRLLASLTEDGLLTRTPCERGSAYRYNAQSGCSGHIHLKCLDCDEVICADESLLDDMRERLGGGLDFAVDSEHTTIYGVCRQCRRNRSDKE